MQLEQDIFIFGDLILLFFTTQFNSIRGHELLLLVLRTCFRGDEAIYLDLKEF